MTLTLPIRIDAPHSAPDETLHVTASGLPVRIYATDGSEPTPIHGAIYINDKWEPRTWLSNGLKYGRSKSNTTLDIRDRPKAKQGVWVAWFENEDGTARYAVARDSKEEASTPRHKLCLKGVAYIEEGGGLDTPADPPLWVDWAKLPSWAKWAAADEDGRVWFYSEKPLPDDRIWGPGSADLRAAPLAKHLHRLAPDFDWRKTLIQRPGPPQEHRGDGGMTCDEMADARRLYEGMRQAGMVG